MNRDDIQVRIVKFGDRPNWQLQWTDPASGRKRTRSSGIKRADKGRDHRAVVSTATRLEIELRDGRRVQRPKIRWAEFRARHKNEVQRLQAKETARKTETVFNLVESHLHPARLTDLTAEALSRWTAALAETRATSTVAGYCARLHAALQWTLDMGLLVDVPKMTARRLAKTDKLMKGRPIVLEEHERMLQAARIVGKERAPDWRLFLNGLWFSGLRLAECVQLSWEPDAAVSVFMQPGYKPAIRFKPEGQKSHRAELLTCAGVRRTSRRRAETKAARTRVSFPPGTNETTSARPCKPSAARFHVSAERPA